MINLLDPKLSKNTKISTNAITDDYYELENLISADINKRRIGFIAYSASKPPIEIIIELKWKICLRMLKAR